jgi:hypothetical protein
LIDDHCCGVVDYSWKEICGLCRCLLWQQAQLFQREHYGRVTITTRLKPMIAPIAL